MSAYAADVGDAIVAHVNSNVRPPFAEYMKAWDEWMRRAGVPDQARRRSLHEQEANFQDFLGNMRTLGTSPATPGQMTQDWFRRHRQHEQAMQRDWRMIEAWEPEIGERMVNAHMEMGRGLVEDDIIMNIIAPLADQHEVE